MKHAHKMVVIAVGLVIATLAVYFQVRTFEFITFDDNLYVYENEMVREGLTSQNFARAFSTITTDEQTYWHPLTWLSHMLDVELFGLAPGGHHLMNLFFHILNVVLLFFALHFMTGAVWKSAFVAALFAVHPINVDSVAWITERKNLLSTTFWMLTMLAYTHYARKPSVVRYALIFTIFAAGLLAKPMLVTLPSVLLLMDFWPLGRISSEHPLPVSVTIGHPFQKAGLARLVTEKIPFLVLSLASIGISLSSLHLENPMAGHNIGPPMMLRLENAIISYAVYLWNLIWPAHLAFYYPFPNIVDVWQTLSAAILLITVTVAAVYRARKNPYLVIGWLWFLGTLVPVLGLVQAGLWPAMADRWVYVPAIGIFMIVAWGIADITAGMRFRKIAIAAPAVILLCVLSILTVRQAGFWRNSRALYEHAIAVTSSNFVAHNNLGNILRSGGDMTGAVLEYQKALAINPVYTLALYNLGFTMKKQGHPEKALQYLGAALRLDPDYANAHELMGRILNETGQKNLAFQHFSRAIALKPNNASIHNNMAAILTNSGQHKKAIFHARQAVQTDPTYADAHFNLGTALSQNGQTDEAIRHFLKAIDLKPDMADAHISLANIYYRRGKLATAIIHYQNALEITPASVQAHTNLANALMGMGRMEEAVTHYRKAIEYDPDVPETYNNLGTALILTGDRQQATQCFQRALTLRPGYESAEDNLRRLEQLTMPSP